MAGFGSDSSAFHTELLTSDVLVMCQRLLKTLQDSPEIQAPILRCEGLHLEPQLWLESLPPHTPAHAVDVA